MDATRGFGRWCDALALRTAGIENKLLVTRSPPRSGQPAKQTMRTVPSSFTEYGSLTVWTPWETTYFKEDYGVKRSQI